MTEPTCRYYQACNAPICPDDKNSMVHCTWYGDEDICKKKDVPGWVKRQRRISKRIGGLGLDSGYFTVEMLKRRTRITGAMRGLNPDKEHEVQLERWMECHQGQKKLSEERRAELSAMMKKIQASRPGRKAKKDARVHEMEG